MNEFLKLEDDLNVKKILFCTYDWVLNINSLNCRILIQTIWFLSLPLIIVYLLSYFKIISYELNLQNMLHISTMFGAIFWALRKIYSDKWTYCANLYNKINELDLLSNSKQKNKLDFMRNTLAIDILDLEIWSNKSFNDFLLDQIKDVKNIKPISKVIYRKKSEVKKFLYEKHHKLKEEQDHADGEKR